MEWAEGYEGKNSKVYKATDVQLNATLAVKQVKKSAFIDVSEYFQEATLLYRNAHPFIVPIHYACSDKASIFLAMPFYKNGSLKTRLKTTALTVREILRYSTNILSGLHSIHSKGLIHFDIKPDNVLISLRDEAQITDFGLAKQTCISGLAEQDRIYGKMTPPEAFSRGTFNRAFDIYQFGLTLHRMCTGDDAFYADYDRFVHGGSLSRPDFKHAVINMQFPKKEYPEHIPQRIIETIVKCLATSPAHRPDSALSVNNLLADIDEKLLDWRYSPLLRSWQKYLEDGSKITLAISASGVATALKTNKDGNARRIADYCKPSLGRLEIKRFLREH